MQNGSLRGPRGDVLPNAIEQEDIGRTSLHEAASIGDEKTLKALLTSGADRNAKDLKHGNTPLHEAAWRGFSRCVKLLCTLPQLKTSKDVKEGKIKDVLEDTHGALHSALLGTRNAGGFSALHLAAQNGHNQSCREILLAGADPDVQNNYGDTPLHTACRYGHAGATRILLSAKCDPNRTNLNGDSPLHISCAMGRRKLTRILLEAGSNREIKNAQNETPRDIAFRKNLVEILEILDNPVSEKPTRDRGRSSSNSKSVDKTDGHKPKGSAKKCDYTTNTVNWSPYGCHYFPDPRSFPSPKLETLPKEPLGKGEQYFLDLAGNIRKGPIGVGNTCYCGPFFRHIEERISRNKKSLKKYVHRATERLDNKVQALALRTDDQIEQLTKSMIAERVRCEGRRLHLEQWLKRGEPTRVTINHHSKSKKNMDNVNTLTRCRSLELLDDDVYLENRKVKNSKSFDMLEEANMVHPNSEPSENQQLNSFPSSSKVLDRCKIVSVDDKLSGDNITISKRLEELLAKTNEIIEIEKIARRRSKDAISSKIFTKKCEETKSLIKQFKNISLHHGHLSKDNDIREFITRDIHKNGSFSDKYENNPPLSPEITKDFASQKEVERNRDQEHEKSSIISENSRKDPSSTGSGYAPELADPELHMNFLSHENANYVGENSTLPESHGRTSNENYRNILSTLRNEPQVGKLQKQNDCFRGCMTNENSLQYPLVKNFAESENFSANFVGVQNEDMILSNFYQNTFLSPSNNILKSESRQLHSEHNYVSEPEEPIQLSEMANVKEINELKSRILNGSNWRSQVLKTSQLMLNNNKEDNSGKKISGFTQKFEIKNSEIKTLKTPTVGILKRNKIQQLVSKIQGNAPDAKRQPGENSESSEEEQDDNLLHDMYGEDNEHFENIGNNTYYPCNNAQSQVAGAYPQCNEESFSQSDLHENIANSARILNTRNLIPKDAYFHELPNKNRLRPIADKLPEKQMINFTDHHAMARTRNPLPFSEEYEGSLKSDVQANMYMPFQECNSRIAHITNIQGRQMSQPEKLLSHRKFAPESEFARINASQQHHHVSPRFRQSASVTPEQAQVDRDVNNDSGYSTKICGSSHGPSPSLSGYTDFGATSANADLHFEPLDNHDVAYFVENVGASSLV